MLTGERAQRRRAYRRVALAYCVAGLVALATALAIDARHPIAVAAWADLAATVAIFAFSVAHRNSSFYDAYWSVAPPALLAYWVFHGSAAGADPARIAMLFGLVALWSVRLTWNWARGFTHLRHEDWRYVRLQEQTGALYWPVSFLGIHLMPTVVVFLGCLPLYVAATAGPVPFGLLDCLATFVAAGAIWLETEADEQLVRYRESMPAAESFLASGLWAHVRHPNYLGEIGFWWGLYLFGVAANPSAWWTIAGPLSITLLFRGVTVSMIDGRMQERRPDYAAHMQRVPGLIPRPWKRIPRR